jgi:quercetin dioxygenase-like cupin family protein
MNSTHWTETLVGTLPGVDLPYGTGAGHVLVGAEAAAVFVHFHERTEVGQHRHGRQWGAVLSGTMLLQIGTATTSLGPGDWYDIPADVDHGAVVEPGTVLIDLFDEPDRFPVAGADKD